MSSNALNSLSQNQYLQASHQLLTWIEQSKANMDDLIDTLPSAYAVVDENGHVLRGNQRLADLLDVNIEGTLGLSLSGLFSSESWQFFSSRAQSLFLTGDEKAVKKPGFSDDLTNNVIDISKAYARPGIVSEVQNLDDEFEIKISNGSQSGATYVWSLRPFKGPIGSGRKWYTVFGRDVTTVKEFERKLSQIYQTIPLGILKVNESFQIHESYSAFSEFLLNEKNLGGKKLFDVLFKPSWAKLSLIEREAIGKIMSSIGSSKLEFDTVRPMLPSRIFIPMRSEELSDISGTTSHGGRWLGVTLEPVLRDRILEGFLVVLIDRTELETQKALKTEKKDKSMEVEAEAFKRFLEVRRLNTSLRDAVYSDLVEYMKLLKENLTEEGEIVAVLSSLSSIKGTCRLAGFTSLFNHAQELTEKLLTTPELNHRGLWKQNLMIYDCIIKEWDELSINLRAFLREDK